MKEVGYHGTCAKYRHNIDKEGLDPAKCKYRSDHWLGQGVYYFDDYDKALWWAANSSSQNNNCGGVIFESLIEAADEKVLNLVMGRCLYLERRAFVQLFLIIIKKRTEYQS